MKVFGALFQQVVHVCAVLPLPDVAACLQGGCFVAHSAVVHSLDSSCVLRCGIQPVGLWFKSALT